MTLNKDTDQPPHTFRTTKESTKLPTAATKSGLQGSTPDENSLRATVAGRGTARAPQSEWWWMTMRWRLLAICSADNRQAIESAIARWSLEATWCLTVQEARRRLRRGSYGLVFCEAILSDDTYKDVIRLLGHKLGQTRVILLSDAPTEECYSQAIEIGVFDVIPASFQRTDIQWIFMQAVQGHPRRQTILESLPAIGKPTPM